MQRCPLLFLDTDNQWLVMKEDHKTTEDGQTDRKRKRELIAPRVHKTVCPHEIGWTSQSARAVSSKRKAFIRVEPPSPKIRENFKGKKCTVMLMTVAVVYACRLTMKADPRRWD